jgi:hypothetical protein
VCKLFHFNYLKFLSMHLQILKFSIYRCLRVLCSISIQILLCCYLEKTKEVKHVKELSFSINRVVFRPKISFELLPFFSEKLLSSIICEILRNFFLKLIDQNWTKYSQDLTNWCRNGVKNTGFLFIFFFLILKCLAIDFFLSVKWWSTL